MKDNGLKASTLRIILAFSLFLIICMICGGFYYAYQQLNTYAAEVYSKAPRTFTSEDEDKATRQLEDEASKYASISSKISEMQMSDKDYQDQIMNDLNKYAALSGLSAPTYNFNQSGTNSGSTTVPGTTTKYFLITMNNPVQYENFIKFLKYIETTLPVIQITGIDITRSGANGTIIVNPMTAGVYVK